MSWQFRKRVKIFPGVTLNIGKKNMSLSLGGRGGHINIGKNGTYISGGIPGTGLYYREKIGPGYGSYQTSNKSRNQAVPNTQPMNLASISSSPPMTLNSQSLESLKITISDIIVQRVSIKNEIQQLEAEILGLKAKKDISKIPILNHFVSEKSNELEEKLRDLLLDLSDAKQCYEETFLDVDLDLEPEYFVAYDKLVNSFQELLKSEKKWDIINYTNNNNSKERTLAKESITRILITLEYKSVNLLKSKYAALHFGNANGSDLYLYPAFLLIKGKNNEFGIIDIRDISLNTYVGEFIEHESVPADAKIVGQTWFKVNKDGSPDKRFQNNYQMPICNYGYIHLKSITGLNELYCFSNAESTTKFGNAFSQYQKILPPLRNK